MEEILNSKKIEIPPLLMQIASEAACPIYIVGGYIRNSLLGLPKSDIDICGQLLPDELNVSAKVIPVNRRLGTALITDGVESYEYTPFRCESYGDGGEHTPQNVTFGATIEEDARRRDFTAGSVYYNVLSGEFIDPYGGLDDIYNRVLRSADPDFTLSDDGLRLMRLARIAAETGFTIGKETFEAAIRCRDRLKDISPERKRQELDKILTADLKYGIKDAHYRGVELLKELKLWEFIIKEVDDMDGMAQNPLYHKYDCLEHSLMAVRFAPPDVRLAALLHDIGKPVCFKRDGNTYAHPVVGADMVKNILGQNGLKYPNSVLNRVSELVKLHMYDMGGKTRENKLKVFIAEHFDLIPDLVSLIEADGWATGTREVISPHRFTIVYNKLIESGAPIKISDLCISGDDVAAAGFRGKQIATQLYELWHDCVIDPSLNMPDKLKEKIVRRKKKLKE
ncbi:MAG: CCA tRNA nucleotidyltransferase [Clostridiales bacterium]|nr:CCA tRNA nucleotidyltransferase [Clostridiales bacterium]